VSATYSAIRGRVLYHAYPSLFITSSQYGLYQ
jgi:hypothetical protein